MAFVSQLSGGAHGGRLRDPARLLAVTHRPFSVDDPFVNGRLIGGDEKREIILRPLVLRCEPHFGIRRVVNSCPMCVARNRDTGLARPSDIAILESVRRDSELGHHGIDRVLGFLGHDRLDIDPARIDRPDAALLIGGFLPPVFIAIVIVAHAGIGIIRYGIPRVLGMEIADSIREADVVKLLSCRIACRLIGRWGWRELI